MASRTSDMEESRTGGCLCGAVTLRARLAEPPSIQACHCGQCRRWTGGGPLFSVRVSGVEIEGEDALGAYHASDWGERVFCTHCGTTLWWKMQGKPVKFVVVGVLDDQSALEVRQEIFVDHRAHWLPAWPEATQSTEAEELAALQAYLAQQGKP
jgi:hypothetical protein